MNNDTIPLIHIITIGDSSVGKTCMILRYSDDKFFDKLSSTIGIEVKSKVTNILKGSQEIMLKIWDTAGQEKFHSLAKSYYRQADGIFVVFDLSNKDSFDKTQRFLDSVEENGKKDAAIVLVGNKCDVERTVTKDEAEDFAEKNFIKYFETSAKTGENINEAFAYLAEQAYLKKPVQEMIQKNPTPTPTPVPDPKQKGYCSC